MTDQELVKKCIAQLCYDHGIDGTRPLSQRDLEFISEEIREKTGTSISSSTLKRLQRGEFTHMPQVATLNAIAACLGHKNWQEYKKSVGANGNGSEKGARKEGEGKMNASKAIFPLAWLIGIALILALLYKAGGPRSHYDKALFSAKKITGNDIPNSVVFTYDIDQVDGDSFFIQQSWDKRRRVRIYKKSHVLTDIYYEPGYHIAKLIADDSVIKTLDVSIPTDNWVLYTSSFQGDRLPQYLKKGEIFDNGLLSLDESQLERNHITTDENTLFVSAYFPSSTTVSSDSLVYKTRIRMKDTRTAQCPFIMFEVYCKKRFMYFRSFARGCASESDANFGEHFLSGKTMDLSPLCFDLSAWTDVELRVTDRKVSIFLNGEKKFTSDYNVSCGGVAGLGIISNGLYEVRGISLKGAHGATVCEAGGWQQDKTIVQATHYTDRSAGY